MALAVALGTGSQDHDLGGSHELAYLVAVGWMGLEWVVYPDYDPYV